MNPGVYIIVNKINGKKYVGSSFNINSRWKDHLSMLRKGVHHSPHFQNAYNIDGEKEFEFIIMEPVEDPNKLVFAEQIWLDYYKSYLPENGYNICKTAGSVLGISRSKDTRIKMSLVKRGENNPMYGKKPSEESRIKISLANKGKVNSEETRRKIREAKLGKPRPLELKNRLSEISKNLWKDPEYRDKNHTCKGQSVPCSSEKKRKISLANQGKVRSVGCKQKLREIMLGKKFSAETKDKMRKSQKSRRDLERGAACPN